MIFDLSRMTRLLLAGCHLGVDGVPLPGADRAIRQGVHRADQFGGRQRVVDRPGHRPHRVSRFPTPKVIHGAAAAPDGSHLYLSNESLADGGRRRYPDDEDHQENSLTGGPNNIAITKDGKKAYVAITGAQGGLDAIDPVAAARRAGSSAFSAASTTRS